MKRYLVPAALLLIAACGSDDTASNVAPDPDGGGSPGSEAGAPDGGGGGNECPRAPKEADRPRKVVVSHPFLGAGTKGTKFEVLDLSATGMLTTGNVTFDMGTANRSPIAFTPDGLVGLVAQDDGSVGAFTFDDAGTLKVVHAKFQEDFYAQAVLIDSSGKRAFVLDSNTDNNGGGLYELAIGCDGTLTSKGRVIPGGKGQAMAFFPEEPGRAVYYGVMPGGDTHILDAISLTKTASGTTFADGEAIASSIAITRDGKYALVADDSLAAGNRTAVVALPAMNVVQTLTTETPAQVILSPFGNRALVLKVESDAISVLGYDAANVATPFTDLGDLAATGGNVQLPSSAVAIERGSLRGRVLISENVSVRMVQFTQDGSLTDQGPLSFGAGIENIVGVVGVQP